MYQANRTTPNRTVHLRSAAGVSARSRTPRRHLRSQRNGNTIILVVGILVLLVIIATAYVTRTHAGRVTASAIKRATLRDDNARVIGDMLAAEIALALFVFPIDSFNDPNDLSMEAANSNTARLSPVRWNPYRYGVDQDFDNDGLPDFPYNFAPYHVVPWTNWPDATAEPWWPGGDGNPGGGMIIDPLLMDPLNPEVPGYGESNPVGNPGFGDARWLGDLEALRWNPNGLTVFSHWRHMTNIARPNNAWRIIGDIEDIEGDIANTGVPSLITNLTIPVEQWTGLVPDTATGTVTGSSFAQGNLLELWATWFSSPEGYKSAYGLPGFIPANFYKLNDLDGNGVGDAWPTDIGPPYGVISQERPESEFIRGTMRNLVSRVLADADGDGYTDSFWFLAPTTNESGIRQVVAVRIIDNSAMANANVMTRAHVFNGLTNASTTGATPSDGALVGHSNAGQIDLQVGFLDNIEHHDLSDNAYGDTWQAFGNEMWDRNETDVGGPDERQLNLLRELGVKFDNGAVHGDFDSLEPLSTAKDRHQYWQWSASRPFDPIFGLTPFSLADEIELRMFYGSNYPGVLSRFERATQPSSLENPINPGRHILRAAPQREESNEYMDQLWNAELAFDMRHRLTTYSGARNDLMPPWLWFNLFPVDYNGDNVIDDAERRQFEADRRKFDLRRTDVLDEFGNALNLDVDGDGVVENQPDLGLNIPPGDDLNSDNQIDNVDLYYRLAAYIERALIDHGDVNGANFGAYVYDEDNDDRVETRKLAYSLAANIMSWRDDDQEPLTLAQALEPPDLVNGPTIDARYIGFEPQPFLVEAIVAHVHEATEAAANHPSPPIVIGDNVICGNSPSSTIVIVQIANPFDKTLDLLPFQINVFGQTHNLSGLLAAGASRIYYSIEGLLEDDEVNLRDEWFELLSMDGLALAPPVHVDDVWSGERDDYDTPDTDETVEIHRGTVLVDRMDIEWPDENSDFRDAVMGLVGALPGGDCESEPPNGDAWPGVLNIDTDDHWIQWVHVARPWEHDFYGTLAIEPVESNPRYVFSFREIDSEAAGEATEELAPSAAFADLSSSSTGRDNDVQNGAVQIESQYLNFPFQMLHKDDDFEQVGELMNVFVWGHELNDSGTETVTTFAEFMADAAVKESFPLTFPQAIRAKPFGNRMRLAPVDLTDGVIFSPVIGNGADANNANGLFDPRHFEPAIPAGARLFDAFVCDGAGALPTVNDFAFNNALGFTGRITPGLINLNTAPPEVLRALPHWTRLVHVLTSPGDNPRMRIAEAVARYREAIGDHDDLLDADLLPGYADRGDTGGFIEDMRRTRGIAAIGELGLITRGADFNDPFLDDVYRMDYAGLGPYGSDNGAGEIDPATVPSTRISLDVNEPRDINNIESPDLVAMDAEERNMLLAGASNMVSTRSDVFTVYFKVRSFRQTPVGPNGFPVWDATNREQIVDDSRYVMLVDRSEVNHPNDKPKILYFEKLPR